jgi:hypothetical protein
MKIVEKVLIILAIVGYVLKLLLIPGGSMLFYYCLIILWWLYFLLVFAFFNGIRLTALFKKDSYKDIPMLHILGSVFAGFALSVGVLGILFKLMTWPGAGINLFVGIIVCLTIIIIIAIRRKDKYKVYYNGLLIRLVAVTILCVALYFLPSITLIRMIYRNEPTYLEACERASQDPRNEQLQQQKEQARQELIHRK